MTKVITDEQNYYDIAEAIRGKLDVETLYLPSEMAAAIETIETGAGLTSADEGKVVVEDAGSYVLAEQTSQTITQNGTYDTTTINELIANVAGGGSANILSGTSAPSPQGGDDGSLYIQYVAAPNGYKLVDYIESSGTQYIDTGIPARVQMRAEIDCQWLGSGDQTVLGGSSNVDNNAIYLGYNSTNNRTYVGYANSWHDFNTNAVDNNRYLWTIDLADAAQQVIIDGVVKATTTNTFNVTTSTTTLYVFSRSNLDKKFVGRIFGIKIYDYVANGALVAHLVPCTRDSDGSVGLYDLVTQTFLENIGTGDFTAGNVVDDGEITDIYLKVNGSWVPIIGQDIDDVDTGGGDEVAANYNFACNWDFTNPSNSRQSSSYQSTSISSVFTIDGWHIQNGTMTIVSGGITLQVYDTTNYGFFMQRFSRYLTSALVGKQVTLTVMFDDTITSLTATFPSANSGTNATSGAVKFRIYNYGTEAAATIDIVTVTSNYVIQAVKIEVGDTQTLAVQDGNEWKLIENADPTAEKVRVDSGVVYNS